MIWVPTWLHSGSQNRLKSFQKSIPRCIKFLIDFCIDFFSILAPSWDPSWGHVGHIFLQNGATQSGDRLPFVGSMLFFDFLVVLDPSWPNLGSILDGLGLHFEGFWGAFWRFRVTICDAGLVGLREAQRILSRIQVSLARFFIGSMYVLVGFGFVLASLCVLAFRPGGMREAIK